MAIVFGNVKDIFDNVDDDVQIRVKLATNELIHYGDVQILPEWKDLLVAEDTGYWSANLLPSTGYTPETDYIFEFIVGNETYQSLATVADSLGDQTFKSIRHLISPALRSSKSVYEFMDSILSSGIGIRLEKDAEDAEITISRSRLSGEEFVIFEWESGNAYTQGEVVFDDNVRLFVCIVNIEADSADSLIEPVLSINWLVINLFNGLWVSGREYPRGSLVYHEEVWYIANGTVVTSHPPPDDRSSRNTEWVPLRASLTPGEITGDALTLPYTRTISLSEGSSQFFSPITDNIMFDDDVRNGDIVLIEVEPINVPDSVSSLRLNLQYTTGGGFNELSLPKSITSSGISWARFDAFNLAVPITEHRFALLGTKSATAEAVEFDMRVTEIIHLRGSGNDVPLLIEGITRYIAFSDEVRLLPKSATDGQVVRFRTSTNRWVAEDE